jgi:YHS domain-containing protein
LEHDGTTLYFCRCPQCTEAFEAHPEHYLTRLAG